jgi:type IV secretory pathway TraG/TraD family ATPase VirD4
MKRVALALTVFLLALGGLSLLLVLSRSFQAANGVLPEPTTWLRQLLTCGMSKGCSDSYGSAFGQQFTYTPLVILFVSFLTLLPHLARGTQNVFTARFSTLKDLADVRLKNWLRHRLLSRALLIGFWVELPAEGREREAVLMGRQIKADKALLAIAPGYGGRWELGHMVIFGMTRAGKSVHLVSQLCTWGGSAVILDIKGELYNKTAGLRAQKGKTFMLTPTGQGHRFDALSAIIASHNGYATAAQLIAAPQLDKEPIFAQRAASGIEAALRAAVMAGEPPMRFIRRLFYIGGPYAFVQGITNIIAGKEAATPEAARTREEKQAREVRLCLNSFLGVTAGSDYNLEHILADRFLVSCWGNMETRLRPFIQEGVQHLFSGSDFFPKTLMRESVSVYLNFPEESLEATTPVYNLIVTGLVRGMQKYFDEELKGKRPKVPVLFTLDEIAAAPLLDLPKNLATAAGRGISAILYLQSPSQFDAIYNKAQTSAILNNCTVQLYYKNEDLATAQYISNRCHKKSVKTRSRSRKRIMFSRPTDTDATTAKELITVDEVMVMGGSERQLALAMISGKHPTLVQRINYYDVAALEALLNRFPAPSVPQLDDSAPLPVPAPQPPATPNYRKTPDLN